MKPRIQNTLGMQVPFQVPSTIEEFGAACGVSKEHAAEVVLKYAIDEAVFRTILPSFRAPFFERLEEETGIGRRQVGKTTKVVDGETVEVPVLEKDAAYFKHVQAETDKVPEDFETLAAEVAADTPFDLTPKPRAGKPGKEYIQRAEGLISAIDAGRGSWNNVMTKLNSQNPGLNLSESADGGIEVEELARALKVDAERRSREQTIDLL